MALSNYLGQSVPTLIIFTGFGYGPVTVIERSRRAAK
jgi:uncharacterized membrane protein YeiB